MLASHTSSRTSRPSPRLSPLHTFTVEIPRVPPPYPSSNSPRRTSYLTAALKQHTPHGDLAGVKRAITLSKPTPTTPPPSTLNGARDTTPSANFPLTTSQLVGSGQALVIGRALISVTSPTQPFSDPSLSPISSKAAMDIPASPRDHGKLLRSTPESLSSTVFLSRSPEPNKLLTSRHIYSSLRVATTTKEEELERGRRALSPLASAPPLVSSMHPDSSPSTSSLPSPASDVAPPHSTGALDHKANKHSCMRRSKSLPGTPRVRFNAMLEQVRHFDADEPVSTSSSNSEDEYYYDEMNPRSRLAYHSDESDEEDAPTGYACAVTVQGLVPIPQEDKRVVAVESVFSSFDQHSVEVTVRVINLSFAKEVVIRYTMDAWRSTTDTLCDWMDGFGGMDRFRGHIPITTSPAKPKRPLQILFAVRYRVAGAEYWDNHDGNNYQATVSWKANDKLSLLATLDTKKRRKKKRKKLVVQTVPATMNNSDDEQVEDKPANVNPRGGSGSDSDDEREISTFLNAPTHPVDENIPLPKKPTTRPHSKYDIAAALAQDNCSMRRREMPKFSSPPASLLGYYLAQAATKAAAEQSSSSDEISTTPVRVHVEGFDEPFGALTLGTSWDAGKHSLIS